MSPFFILDVNIIETSILIDPDAAYVKCLRGSLPYVNNETLSTQRSTGD
jgi:hypothetical protein